MTTPPPVSFRRHLAVLGLGALVALFAAWLTGLCLFVTTVNGYAEPTSVVGLPHVDGIVVLTGGSDRLDTGLALLASGNGKKLLISGVPEGLTLERRLAQYPVPADTRACCVMLGHTAADTVGNAEEARAWAFEQGFRSIRLVTANYHMPRSLLIFRAMLPDVVIVPHPVAPDSVRLDGWWWRMGTTRLLIAEYDKYLMALVLARLRPFF